MTNHIAAAAVAGTLALFLGSSASSAAVLINGSFEQPDLNGGAYASYAAGNTSITGWTIASGSVDVVGSLWEAADGDQSLDLSGNNAGSIYQDVATIVGQAYRLSFALSGNPDGTPTSKSVKASAGTTSGNYAFDISGIGRNDMQWRIESLDFIASSAITRIAFESFSDSFYGPALDDVELVAVPSPTAAMSGLALLAIPALRRRGA